MSYTIYQKHGVISNLSGTRRHIPFIRNSALYSIYQEHGGIFHIWGTRRPIRGIDSTGPRPTRRSSSPCPIVCSLCLFTPTFGSLTVSGNKLKNDLLIEEFSATERLSVLVTKLGSQAGRQPELSVTCRLLHRRTVPYDGDRLSCSCGRHRHDLTATEQYGSNGPSLGLGEPLSMRAQNRFVLNP